jgi:hypothetical protein
MPTAYPAFSRIRPSQEWSLPFTVARCNCFRNGSAVAHDVIRSEAIRRLVELGLAKGNDTRETALKLPGVTKMKKLSPQDWMIWTLFAFVATGTVIAVFYWLYWTGGYNAGF